MPSPQDLFFQEIRKEASLIYDERGFLTDLNIKQIWSETRYDKILSLNPLGFPSDSPEAFRVRFLEMRSKILLILVEINWLGWDRCYQSLLGDKCKDEALPLVDNDLGFLEYPYNSYFQRKQWRFIPQKLKENRLKIQTYKRRTKLPFIKTAKEDIDRDRCVTKESIPAGYWEDRHGNCNTKTKVVARKLLKTSKYQVEIQNLLRFRESRSTNDGIMKSLAYVEIELDPGQECSIIMDVADTDLHKYLPYKKATFPDDQNPKLRDLLTEAAALAGALDWLHEDIQSTEEILACCHMDLKPDNILIFNGPCSSVGRWKIADFSISAIRNPKRDLGRSNDDQAPQDTMETIVTQTKREPGPYTAPEVTDRSDKVGRSSDLWSYGCILTDVIASKLAGEASLCSLTKRRGLAGEAEHWNDYYYREGALNPNVQNWIDALDKARTKEDHLETDALSDCKNLLKDILVVEGRRTRARDIRKRLINAKNTIPASEGAPYMTEIDGEDKTPQPTNITGFENKFQATEAEKLSRIDHRIVADTMLLSKTKEWLRAPEPSALWINDSPTAPTSSIGAVSPICSGLFQAAQSAEIFVTVYLCQRQTGGRAATATKLNMLVDLTHSLIYQLQRHLNKSSPPTQPVDQTIFDALHGTATLENAISVLSSLWASVPSRWFCVIDGFHILEDHTEPILVSRIEALLAVLCPSFRGGAAGDQNRCKTLISTSAPSLFLRKLPFKSILDNKVRSGSSLPVTNDFIPVMKKLRS